MNIADACEPVKKSWNWLWEFRAGNTPYVSYVFLLLKKALRLGLVCAPSVISSHGANPILEVMGKKLGIIDWIFCSCFICMEYTHGNLTLPWLALTRILFYNGSFLLHSSVVCCYIAHLECLLCRWKSIMLLKFWPLKLVNSLTWGGWLNSVDFWTPLDPSNCVFPWQ